MTHKEKSTLLLKLSNEAHAFLRKNRIAHRQRLIHHQNIRINVSDYSKCQAHQHATGISLNRLLDKITNISKFGNFVETSVNLCPAQTKQCGIHIYVFTAWKLRIKT